MLGVENRTLYERFLIAARSQVEEEVWEKDWEEGQAMTLEEAIAYALAAEAETLT